VSPIAVYLDDLGRLLRRGTRRRVLSEVRGHLLDAADACRARGAAPLDAERRAVARFGTPAEVARAFNELARRRSGAALARRTGAVLLASAATASLGTATVWALEPGAHASAPRTHHALHAHHARVARPAR